ncbi:uncharacterized protein TNCV_4903941 [Trichonephila clavipes]|nr:uncharacterized protein TNCV_4903941 [Trichonephila clavipes]
MVSWDYLWPTLRCRREAGVSPLLSIGWWYLSSESPKRHCCRVSVADKGCRIYPLDPRPDAVALYSGCTSGGEPKTVKRLRSGDILIETHTALQTKSFLLANTFRDSPVTICPHKSLNTSRGVISESDLLSTSESEILQGFSDQNHHLQPKPNSYYPPLPYQLLTQSQPPIPTSNDAPSTNDMFTSIGTSSPIIPTSSSHSVIQPPSASHIQDTKKISKVRARKRKKELLKKM